MRRESPRTGSSKTLRPVTGLHPSKKMNLCEVDERRDQRYFMATAITEPGNYVPEIFSGFDLG
jgi:hypothetical protein